MHVCIQMCLCVSCMSNLYVSLFSVIDSFRRDQAAIQRHIKFARFHYTPQFVSRTALCSFFYSFSTQQQQQRLTARTTTAKETATKIEAVFVAWSAETLYSLRCAVLFAQFPSRSFICAVVRGHENGNSAQSASALSVAVDVTSMRTLYIYLYV